MDHNLDAENFKQFFEKKISLDTKELKPEEFFNLISKETGINFIYIPQENDPPDFKISILGYKEKAIKVVLDNLSNTTFDFLLKFDKNNPYIYVRLKDSFKTKIKKGFEKKEGMDVSLEGASLKDIFSILEAKTGKKFEIEKNEILEKKTYLKIDNVEWEEFLKKLSKEAGFDYEIGENKVRIW
jgi:hypothetical protein